MLLNPEVQAKAQAQLDTIVGTDRLPEFDDLPSLPYVEATLMETLRYHPVIPFSMRSLLSKPQQIPTNYTSSATAHAIIEDDEYKGFRIPKGATVIPNAWYGFLQVIPSLICLTFILTFLQELNARRRDVSSK